MQRHAAARIRLRLRYSERAIGAFVDTEIVTLTPDLRVSDALRLLRRAGRRSGHTLYVLDERRHLAGVLDLADLVAARDRALIQGVMRPPGIVLNARAALHTVSSHFAWLTHESLPVINRDGVFQGVLERSQVTEEETQLPVEVAEVSELQTTRGALADIFWMGVGAFLATDTDRSVPNKSDT
jgi:magnesium transporter